MCVYVWIWVQYNLNINPDTRSPSHGETYMHLSTYIASVWYSLITCLPHNLFLLLCFPRPGGPAHHTKPDCGRVLAANKTYHAHPRCALCRPHPGVSVYRWGLSRRSFLPKNWLLWLFDASRMIVHRRDSLGNLMLNMGEDVSFPLSKCFTSNFNSNPHLTFPHLQPNPTSTRIC